MNQKTYDVYAEKCAPFGPCYGLHRTYVCMDRDFIKES